MVLEYFCLACHAYNKQRVLDVEIAEEMTAAGVPTTIVRVPLEVMERAEAVEHNEAIDKAECLVLEETSLLFFNQVALRELGMGKAR